MQNSTNAVVGPKFFESRNIQKLVDDKSLQFRNPLWCIIIILAAFGTNHKIENVRILVFPIQIENYTVDTYIM